MATVGIFAGDYCAHAEGATPRILHVQAESAAVSPDGSTWALAFPAIGAAMEAAEAGDQVWVGAGVYWEKLELKARVALLGGFSGEEAALDDRRPDWHLTVLDGQGEGPVIIVQESAGHETRIDGFVIQNGGGVEEGGGILCLNASPVIANNQFRGNNAKNGGAIALRNSSSIVEGNRFAENTASTDGGAVYCWDSSPVIRGNSFVHNASSIGGAVAVYNSEATVSGNIFGSNRSEIFGGAIVCTWSSTDVLGNIFLGNTTGWSLTLSFGGGGLMVFGGSARIASNHFEGNMAAAFQGSGGAISSLQAEELHVIGNTFLHNRARTGGAMQSATPVVAVNNLAAYNSSGFQVPSGSMIRNNCFHGQEGTDMAGSEEEVDSSNLFADPLMRDEEWFPRLLFSEQSPCRGAGDPEHVDEAWLDLFGKPRLSDGLVDIGAAQFDPEREPKRRIIRVSPSGDDRHDGEAWERSMRTVQAALNAAAVEGAEIWIAEGIYREAIRLSSMSSLYGGFQGGEVERNERNWGEHETVLDASGLGRSVILGEGLERFGSVDGFTITGGRNQVGGGMSLRNSTITIENNKFVGNHSVLPNGIYGEGGGIRANQSSCVITGNMFRDNVAAHGSAVYAFYSPLVLTGNRIEMNRTMRGRSPFPPGMQSGGAVSLYSSPSVVANNLITGNIHHIGSGGFLHASGLALGDLQQEWDHVIINNTISKNVVVGDSGMAAGALYLSGANSLVANNIIAWNWPSGMGGPRGYATNNIIRNNCLQGFVSSALELAESNIIGDPLFVPPFMDPYLRPDSPCIDAGDASIAGQWLTDVLGQPRLFGQSIDIGAIEYQGTPMPPDDRRVRVSLEGDDANDGSSWERAKRTVKAALEQVTPLGGEIWVREGEYSANLEVGPFIYMHGGFSGTESSAEERDWARHPTILDGGLGGSVLRISGWQSRENYNAVTGFTIQNGLPGMMVQSSSVIAHNKFVRNQTGLSSWGSPRVENNLFLFNETTGFGGGIDIASWGDEPALILNNTFIGNKAARGGGIYVSRGAPRLINNLIVGNSSGIQRDTFPWGGSLSAPVLRQNLVFGNETGYVWVTPGETDIQEDPRLISPENHPIFGEDSPAVDAGENGWFTAGARDYFGRPRVAGAGVDIGAFEFNPEMPVVPWVEPVSVSIEQVLGMVFAQYATEGTAPGRLIAAAPVVRVEGNKVVLSFAFDLDPREEGTGEWSGTVPLGAMSGEWDFVIRSGHLPEKVIQITFPSQGRHQLQMIRARENGMIELMIEGVAEAAWLLQASKDLIEWETVDSAEWDGSILVLDSAGHPARFFRLVYP